MVIIQKAHLGEKSPNDMTNNNLREMKAAERAFFFSLSLFPLNNDVETAQLLWPVVLYDCFFSQYLLITVPRALEGHLLTLISFTDNECRSPRPGGAGGAAARMAGSF